MDKQTIAVIFIIFAAIVGIILIFTLGGSKSGGNSSTGGNGGKSGGNGGNGGNVGNVGDVNLTSKMKDQFLNLQNSYRNKASAGPLNWSDDLASGAQKWLNYLCEKENCGMRHPGTLEEKNEYLNNDSWGQNLAHYQGETGSPENAVQNWGPVECQNYDPNNPTKGEVGHFTQMVWKGTTEVGCAKATKGNDTLWGCNYNPAGNVIYDGGDSYYVKNVTKPNPCSL